MKKYMILAALSLVMVGCVETTTKTKTTNMNPVVENIMSRKSIRQFTAEAVSEAQIDTLLRCAMAAPTAVNCQPWEFMVLTDREILDTLGERFPNTRITKNVGVAIVPCGNLEKAFKPAPEFWVDDLSAATENILLAAHSMGLGAVWTGVYPTDRTAQVQQILGLPEHVLPLCIIPVGYPAEDPVVKDKYKVENIHYNRW